MRKSLALAAFAVAVGAAGGAQAQSSRALLDVLDRMTREANFRNSEVNDGRPETNLQMPLRATGYPGLCSQDQIRIRDAGSPTITLEDIAATTTFRAVSDPRPRSDAPGSPYFQTLDAECRKYEVAGAHAPNALTAWAGAYAVALVRAELEKLSSPLLTFSCDDAAESCERTVLLQFIKPDGIVRASLADCAGGRERCVKVSGFYDAYAAKVQEKAVFVTLTARFEADGAGVGAFKGAQLSQELVEGEDD